MMFCETLHGPCVECQRGAASSRSCHYSTRVFALIHKFGRQQGSGFIFFQFMPTFVQYFVLLVEYHYLQTLSDISIAI